MGALARIILRYAITWALAKGFIVPEVADMINADPEILSYLEAALMALSFAVIEGWYYLAKRWGWST